MTTWVSRISRAAYAYPLSAMLSIAASQPAMAQFLLDVDPEAQGADFQINLPMNDAKCDYAGSVGSIFVPPCVVDGSRTVTLNGETRTPINPAFERVTGHYSVAFDGRLHVDGLPISTVPGTPNSWPFNYENLFGNGGSTVDLATTYDGEFSFGLPNGAPLPPVDPAYLFNISNVATTVRAIDAFYDGYINTTDGGDYEFGISTIDPTAIVNGNSVALTGSFNGTSGSGAIQFGKITGTATLATGGAVTPYPNDWYGSEAAYYSNFGLVYDVSAQITTQLDENGLLTPRIEVSEGIEMNGSKITGLAAGTAPTDAVNKAQLDAEAQARIAADLALADGLATEATTRAAADVALGQRIATQEAASAQLAADLQSESNARAAADLSLASQIGTLNGRMDAMESRVDRLEAKMASSTAVAVAMSGNTFLPDTTFNLTANVATYDGAQAGSFQVGAMVSKNVAVNAGVATGFNKGGKTAGRVGFTVGW